MIASSKALLLAGRARGALERGDVAMAIRLVAAASVQAGLAITEGRAVYLQTVSQVHDVLEAVASVAAPIAKCELCNGAPCSCSDFRDLMPRVL